MPQNVVEITFSIEGDRPKIVEEIEGLIAALLHQGQIIGQEIIITDEPNKLVYICYAPTDTSLQEQYFSEWGTASLAKLLDDGCTMSWRMISTSADNAQWETAEYFKPYPFWWTVTFEMPQLAVFAASSNCSGDR